MGRGGADTNVVGLLYGTRRQAVSWTADPIGPGLHQQMERVLSDVRAGHPQRAWELLYEHHPQTGPALDQLLDATARLAVTNYAKEVTVDDANPEVRYLIALARDSLRREMEMKKDGIGTDEPFALEGCFNHTAVLGSPHLGAIGQRDLDLIADRDDPVTQLITILRFIHEDTPGRRALREVLVDKQVSKSEGIARYALKSLALQTAMSPRVVYLRPAKTGKARTLHVLASPGAGMTHCGKYPSSWYAEERGKWYSESPAVKQCPGCAKRIAEDPERIPPGSEVAGADYAVFENEERAQVRQAVNTAVDELLDWPRLPDSQVATDKINKHVRPKIIEIISNEIQGREAWMYRDLLQSGHHRKLRLGETGPSDFTDEERAQLAQMAIGEDRIIVGDRFFDFLVKRGK